MLQSRGAGQSGGTGGTAEQELAGGAGQMEGAGAGMPQETEAPQEFARPERGSLLSQPTPQPQQPGNLMTTDSGLQFEDLVVGQGPNAQYGQTVTVHYTGWLTNGTKFDSSLDKGQPFQFVLGAGEVIKGWDEGVSTMRIGGRRRLIIPPQLGYGDRGAGGVIPPGATLVFEVELLGAQ
jgi:FKBP-type peptidyl-prolyl cis-trans isomerase